MKCLEPRENQIFANKVVLAGWFLDKSLSLMDGMAKDKENRGAAKDVIRAVYKKHCLLSGQTSETEDIIQVDTPIVPFNSCVDPLDGLLQVLGTASEIEASPVTQRNHRELSALEKEISSYEKTAAPPTRICAMKWWQEKADIYPILSQIALDIISAPVTEVTVERLFSHLKIVMTRHRSMLKGDLIDDLLFLRVNRIFAKKSTNS
jgi:hypothetical protein